jgi:hypothetical protein
MFGKFDTPSPLGIPQTSANSCWFVAPISRGRAEVGRQIAKQPFFHQAGKHDLQVIIDDVWDLVALQAGRIFVASSRPTSLSANIG